MWRRALNQATIRTSQPYRPTHITNITTRSLTFQPSCSFISHLHTRTPLSRSGHCCLHPPLTSIHCRQFTTQPTCFNSSASSSSIPSTNVPTPATTSKSKSKKLTTTSSPKDAATASPSTESAAASSFSQEEAYLTLRQQELREAGLCDATGAFTYPNTYKPTLSIDEFIAQYSSLTAGEKSSDEVCLSGRIHSKRAASNKLIFYDLIGSSPVMTTTTPTTPPDATTATGSSAPPTLPTTSTIGVDSTTSSSTSTTLTAFTSHSPKIQIMATLAAFTPPSSNPSAPSTSDAPASPPAADADPAAALALRASFQRLHRLICRGDLVWVRGRPQKTKTGELSLVPTEFQLLAPCWREIPTKLTEPNTRYRHRYLDMLVNRSILHPFHLRARVLATLRSFLTQRAFVEVETPILWTNHGGANAKPFRTSSNALGSQESVPLYLRIAPELFLKELVIGGMERVFEVSKVFRNEGMDATHNPEFTTCEFYMAWKNYHDLIQLTQEMLLEIVQTSLGTSKVRIRNRFNQEEVEIDFAQPFKQLDIMTGLQEAIGSTAELPDPNSAASLPFYLSICKQHHISVPLPHTLPRVLDKLIGHFLEPQCIHPTVLLNHPECMSPLARRHPARKGLTERFELFINGQEYCNAYSELNDPSDQYARMLAQSRASSEGDEEAQPLDHHFCRALDYGLPPTAGWGLGIDRSVSSRLVMLLSGTNHIRVSPCQQSDTPINRRRSFISRHETTTITPTVEKARRNSRPHQTRLKLGPFFNNFSGSV